MTFISKFDFSFINCSEYGTSSAYQTNRLQPRLTELALLVFISNKEL